MRIFLGVTASKGVNFLRGQIADAVAHGYEVFLVVGEGPDARQLCAEEGATYLPVPFERKISPLKDLRALFRVLALIRRYRPDIVNAGTPKASLLLLIAAWLMRVPTRIYTVRGLRSDTARGISRRILHTCERIAGSCATRIICVSPSLRAHCVSLGLFRSEKTITIGSGSSNGIDCLRFARTPAVRSQGSSLRASLAIHDDEIVLGFVGRLTRDKGLEVLYLAWKLIRERYARSRLLVVGDFESGDPVPASVRAALQADPRVHLLGRMKDPVSAYAAMDVFVFPSFREGFGNVAAEANAMELPVVASRVPGIIDAIQDGETGVLVPPGDANELAEAIGRYIDNAALRRSHGKAGRARVLRLFDPRDVWAGLRREYERSEAVTVELSS